MGDKKKKEIENKAIKEEELNNVSGGIMHPAYSLTRDVAGGLANCGKSGQQKPHTIIVWALFMY